MRGTVIQVDLGTNVGAMMGVRGGVMDGGVRSRVRGGGIRDKG